MASNMVEEDIDSREGVIEETGSKSSQHE